MMLGTTNIKHIHILEFSTGDWIASGSCRHFHWREKNHLFLLDITGGIRSPEMQVFPFKIITATHVPTYMYSAALVNGAVRSAASDRSGTPDLKKYIYIYICLGQENTRPYI